MLKSRLNQTCILSQTISNRFWQKSVKGLLSVSSMITRELREKHWRCDIPTSFSSFFGEVVSCHWLWSVPIRFANIWKSEESVSLVEIMFDIMVSSYFKGSNNEKQSLPLHFSLFFSFLSVWHQYSLCSLLFNTTHSERPLPLSSICQKDQ